VYVDDLLCEEVCYGEIFVLKSVFYLEDQLEKCNSIAIFRIKKRFMSATPTKV
jgi:hypothetical protein